MRESNNFPRSMLKVWSWLYLIINIKLKIRRIKFPSTIWEFPVFLNVSWIKLANETYVNGLCISKCTWNRRIFSSYLISVSGNNIINHLDISNRKRLQKKILWERFFRLCDWLPRMVSTTYWAFDRKNMPIKHCRYQFQLHNSFSLQIIKRQHLVYWNAT
jgi:hypothetical protein